MAYDYTTDPAFKTASAIDQKAYLMHVDADFAKATPQDQAAYLTHIKGLDQPTQEEKTGGKVPGYLQTIRNIYAPQDKPVLDSGENPRLGNPTGTLPIGREVSTAQTMAGIVAGVGEGPMGMPAPKPIVGPVARGAVDVGGQAIDTLGGMVSGTRDAIGRATRLPGRFRPNSAPGTPPTPGQLRPWVKAVSPEILGTSALRNAAEAILPAHPEPIDPRMGLNERLENVKAWTPELKPPSPTTLGGMATSAEALRGVPDRPLPPPSQTPSPASAALPNAAQVSFVDKFETPKAEPSRIAAPDSPPPPVKTTYQSYPRETLVKMAAKGDLKAIAELRRNPAGFDLPPNVKYLVEPNAQTQAFRNYSETGQLEPSTLGARAASVKPREIIRFDEEGAPKPERTLGQMVNEQRIPGSHQALTDKVAEVEELHTSGQGVSQDDLDHLNELADEFEGKPHPQATDIKAQIATAERRAAQYGEKSANAQNWVTANRYLRQQHALEQKVERLQQALKTGKPVAPEMKGATKAELHTTYNASDPDVRATADYLADLYKRTEDFGKSEFESHYGLKNFGKGLPVKERLARFLSKHPEEVRDYVQAFGSSTEAGRPRGSEESTGPGQETAPSTLGSRARKLNR